MTPPSLSRRALMRLAVAGTVGTVLAGCSRSDRQASGTGPSAASAPAVVGALGTAGDVTLVQNAVAGERRLLALCHRAIREVPGLRGELAPVAAIAARHIRELQQAAEDTAAPPPAPVDDLPGTPLAVKATVQQQLRAEQRDRATGCLAAESGALAQLFGSMSASHAMSAAALAAARTPR